MNELLKRAFSMFFMIAGGVFGPIGWMRFGIYLISQRLVMWSVGLFLYTGADDENVVQYIIE